MNRIYLKFDAYLALMVMLIIVVFKAHEYTFVVAIPVLLISYYRFFVNQDITTALILMLSARLIMGPVIPNSDLSFNVLNVICNYLPITIILSHRLINIKAIPKFKLLHFKWTILFVLFMLFLSLFNLKLAITVFSLEILPLILFLLIVLTDTEKKIDFHYLLKFFRYSFVACLIVYLSPYFSAQVRVLFGQGILFKEAVPMMVFEVFRTIPRHVGFVFDFRIMGQLACLYLIILYYLGKTKSYWDIILLTLVCLLTFSRGPILILILMFIAIYAPFGNRITKTQLLVIASSVVVIICIIIISFNNATIQRFVQTFNPVSKENAISQRGAFINYSLDKFYEKPYGNGIGVLSSPQANVRVFAGYTNFHKKVPDKVIYTKVGDAFLALSLAEKGIFGFILMLLSFSEIFYSNRNKLSLFFLMGLYINMIGTDIPKQGFFYLILILLYYSASELERSKKLSMENDRP